MRYHSVLSTTLMDVMLRKQNDNIPCTSVTWNYNHLMRGFQKIAIAFGGDETPPGWFSGVDVKKKDQRSNCSHVWASCSRSKSSPTSSILVNSKTKFTVVTYLLASPNLQVSTRAAELDLVVAKPRKTASAHSHISLRISGCSLRKQTHHQRQPQIQCSTKTATYPQ